MAEPIYSFVIPIFNEEETLAELYRKVVGVGESLDGSFEVILVDDGSRDHSHELMLDIQSKDRRFKVVSFARNFGHQVAITAGMDFAGGDAVIIMDADLQDPPEVVLEMAKKWREGFGVVYAVRKERAGETWFKKLTAKYFYRFLQKLTDVDIPQDVGDFRLVDRKALEAFKRLRESNRFVRGIFSWVGFRQTGVEYTRAERFAGQTKYPLSKMLKLAADGILSFSNVPLALALNLGFVVSAISFMLGITAIVVRLAGMYTVSGWASMTVIISFLGGIQLMVMGFLGQYIGRIHDEVKGRPLYIVKSLRGFDEQKNISPERAVVITKYPR